MVRSLIPLSTPIGRTFANLHSEVDNLLDTFLSVRDSKKKSFAPPIDIAESESGFEIMIDLPGWDSDDVHIELENGVLSIVGEKEHESDSSDKTFYRLERRQGSFRRLIAVPKIINAEHIDAQFVKGVLTISLPKMEKELPKTIEVRSNE